MYNLEQAVQRLQWRFTNNKAFKPNENDIKAINLIFEWINNEKKNNVLKHVLFAKLYIYELNRTIRDYDSDIFEDINQVHLHKLLNTPLDKFIEAFHNDLHHNQIKEVIERVNKNKIANINNEDISNLSKEDLDKLTKGVMKERYSLEEVNTRLLSMVTDALNKFS